MLTKRANPGFGVSPFFEKHVFCVCGRFFSIFVEIIITSEYQKSGIGTKMMAELEGRVKEIGAAMVQLVSVNDGCST